MASVKSLERVPLLMAIVKVVIHARWSKVLHSLLIFLPSIQDKHGEKSAALEDELQSHLAWLKNATIGAATAKRQPSVCLPALCLLHSSRLNKNITYMCRRFIPPRLAKNRARRLQ